MASMLRVCASAIASASRVAATPAAAMQRRQLVSLTSMRANRSAARVAPRVYARTPLRTISQQPSSDGTGQEGQQQQAKKPRTARRVLGAIVAGVVGVAAYDIWLMRNEETYTWQLLMWKTLPLRFLSHLWGSVHRIDLPVFLRRPLYLAWTRAFDCQLHEIADGGESTLDSFPNLNAFFIRRIDLAKYRPLAADEMISPVDGRVNVFGEVTPNGLVEQIKGMEYRVDDLLGFTPPPLKPDSRMYYYVLYLAPGDYHRMHTPAACTIDERRHFPGALYPVLPSIAAYVPSLFVRNERVVLSGGWSHGFFAMVPVGAYNVGSMKLTFDAELDTNLRTHTFVQYRPNLDDGLKSKPFFKSYRTTDATQLRAQRSEVDAAADDFAHTDPASTAQPQERALAFSAAAASRSTASNELGQHVPRVDSAGVHLAKGDEFARFELGSTIVVFFEMDRGQEFNWNIEMNQKVRLGQRLGVITNTKKA